VPFPPPFGFFRRGWGGGPSLAANSDEYNTLPSPLGASPPIGGSPLCGCVVTRDRFFSKKLGGGGCVWFIGDKLWLFYLFLKSPVIGLLGEKNRPPTLSILAA